MTTAFIIGNGASRKDFDLTRLLDIEDTTIYGCNALYRDFAPEYKLPHYLVAIDEGIIKEIVNSTFPRERVILPPADERWEPWECNNARPRSNAGMNAMIEAIKRGATTIIGFGFDFLMMDQQSSVSNLYDGTPNYGPETRANANDNPGRCNYLNWLARKNPNVQFIFVFPEITKMRDFSASNISVLTIKQLFDNISR